MLVLKCATVYNSLHVSISVSELYYNGIILGVSVFLNWKSYPKNLYTSAQVNKLIPKGRGDNS